MTNNESAPSVEAIATQAAAAQHQLPEGEVAEVTSHHEAAVQLLANVATHSETLNTIHRQVAEASTALAAVQTALQGGEEKITNFITAITGGGLPGFTRAYNSLRDHGEQFADVPGSIVPLPGITYTHPSRGEQQVEIDRRALQASGCVYTDNPELNGALQEHGARTATVAGEGLAVIEEFLDGDATLWGFSGFATVGPKFEAEAEAMSELFDHLKAIGQEPGAVSTGAARAGGLGLATILAQKHNIPTIGFTPLQGLSTVSPQDHMYVKKDTYQEREELVGAMPDVLWCVAGGPGTEREAEAAIKKGGVVVLMALQTYKGPVMPNTYRNNSILREAEDKGNLVVCTSKEEIPQAVADIQKAAAAKRKESREIRRDFFRKALAAKPKQ